MRSQQARSNVNCECSRKFCAWHNAQTLKFLVLLSEPKSISFVLALKIYYMYLVFEDVRSLSFVSLVGLWERLWGRTGSQTNHFHIKMEWIKTLNPIFYTKYLRCVFVNCSLCTVWSSLDPFRSEEPLTIWSWCRTWPFP